MPLDDRLVQSMVSGEAVYQKPERGLSLSDVDDWAGATVVDIGKTVWNSLTPDDWNTETDDLLTWFGATDAARFYEENRDLVEASSFFGGLLIPFGPASLATRAVSLMKTGKLASVRGNPFAAFDRKLKTNRQQTLDLVAAGDKATEAYKRLRRERLALTGGEAVLDSFATEAMIAGMMNEHGWLKDYSATEFIFGGFLGAGIVAPIRWISDAKDLKMAGSDIELGQIRDVSHLISREYPVWMGGSEILKESRAKLDALQTQLDASSGGSEGYRLAWLQNQVDREFGRFDDTLRGMLDGRAAKQAEKQRPPKEGPLFELGARTGTVDEGTYGELVHLLRSDPAANGLDGVQRITTFNERSSLADDYVVTEFNSVRRTEVPARQSQAGETEVHLDINDSAQVVDLLYGKGGQRVKTIPVDAARQEYEAALRAGEVSGKIDFSRNGTQFVITVDNLEVLNTKQAQKYITSITQLNPTGGIRLVTTQDHKAINKLYSSKVERTGKPRERDRLTGALRPSDELPVQVDDPSVVFDPWLRAIIPATDAALALRAADAAHKPASGFDYSKTFDPLRDNLSTWEADSTILDAVNASRSKPFREAELNFGLKDTPQFAAVAATGRFSNLTIEGITVDSASAFIDVAKQHKVAEIQRFAEGGFAPEQISIYTNTPLETVNTLIAERMNPSAIADADLAQLFTYTSNDSTYLKKVLRKAKWKLQGETVRSQSERQMNPAKVIDEMQKGSAEDAFIFEAVTNPGTPQAFLDLYDQNFTGDSLRILRDGTAQALSTFKAGNRFFGSSDQALRAFGETGIVATSIGTNTNRAAQRLAGEITSKIAPLARAIQVDPTGKSQTQFHAFMRAYRSQSGEALQGSRYDPATGRVVLKNDKHLTYPDTGGVVSIASDSPVGRWLLAMQDDYNPLSRQARDTNRRLVGETQATPAGLYIPYIPMDERLVAYIFNADDATKTRVIVGRSEEQLATFVKEAQKTAAPNERVVTRGSKGEGEKDMFEQAHGYSKSGGRLERADSGQRKSGISVIDPTPTADEVFDIVDAISAEMHNAVRTFTHHSLGRVFRDLDEIASYHNRFAKSGNRGIIKKAGIETIDPATTMRRTLLNINPQDSDTGWAKLGNGFDTLLNWSLNALNRSALGNLVKTPVRSAGDFDDMVAQMRREGIPMAWADYESYLRSNVPDYQKMSQPFINTMSGLMTNLNLRILEFAHAAVTTLSTPVLLANELTLSRNLASSQTIRTPTSTTTVTTGPNQSVTFPLKYMVQGVKTALGSDPQSVAIRDRMRAKGYGEAHIAEVGDTIQSVAASPGLIGGTLSAVDSFNRSKAVEFMGGATNWAERWTRELSYYTGYHQAKEAFPGISEELAEHYAQAFVKRAMGNYTTSQRPTMFQGTMGQSLGLYQTFMLTFAQSIFRHLEAGDRRALMLVAGAQGGMFGLSSLPGYEFINTTLQDHVMKDDMNIETTAFRLFGSTELLGVNVAETLVYGLPSAMFDAGLSSRASLDVRLPVGLGEEGELSIIPPIASGFIQSIEAMKTMGSQFTAAAAAGGGAWDYATAFSQAVSMQSMWRPGARMAEIFQGYTVDRNGRILDNDTRDNGVFQLSHLVRVSGMRPLHEHVLRQARYSNRYLDARDRENRRKHVQQMRRYMADPTASSASLGSMFQSYMDGGGTAQGWTQAVNLANRDANVSEAVRLRKELDREPGLQDIVDSYVY